jgi:hypothetical protein
LGAWDAAIPADDPRLANGAALMYSGGCDSTLAACRLAQRFPKVHLVTFTRFGFIQTDAPSVHAERMKRRFAQTEFVAHKIAYGKFYEEIESFHRLRSLWKHGTMTSVPCGHCKISMHWRNLLFCLENGVKFAADGAVTGNEQFAEQNPKILMPELVDFYGQFGVTLVHPVHEPGLSTEAELFSLGITDQLAVKRTRADKQVICSQHILLAAYMRRYLASHTFEEYEAESKLYLNTKLEHARELTAAHVASGGAGSAIASMLA